LLVSLTAQGCIYGGRDYRGLRKRLRVASDGRIPDGGRRNVNLDDAVMHSGKLGF